MSQLHAIFSHSKTVSVFWQLYRQFESIQGFLGPLEGFVLFTIANIGTGQGAVLEIGSYKGLSTCWLAAGLESKNQTVFAVDHFGGSQEHSENEKKDIYQEFMENISRQSLQNNVTVLKYSSEQAEQYWARAGGQPIRLLFIDGDHSYEGVKKDFYLWEKYVCPDGIICFHDYQTKGYPDVTRFVDGLLATTSDFGDVFQAESLKVIQKIHRQGKEI